MTAEPDTQARWLEVADEWVATLRTQFPRATLHDQVIEDALTTMTRKFLDVLDEQGVGGAEASAISAWLVEQVTQRFHTRTMQ
ncbi:MAG: hypothetical protein ACR2RL_25080 [Gammaproteobacteria bacterium]